MLKDTVFVSSDLREREGSSFVLSSHLNLMEKAPHAEYRGPQFKKSRAELYTPGNCFFVSKSIPNIVNLPFVDSLLHAYFIGEK